jgi:hypothetical protein
MRYVSSICVVVLTGFLSLVCWDLHKLLTVGLGQIDSIAQNANNVLISAHDTETKLNSAADAESAYWDKASRESLKVIAATKEVLVRTDCNLNGGPGCPGALPMLTATLKNTAGLTQQTQEEISALGPAIQNLSKASASAAEIMSDPSIRDSLRNVDATSIQMAGVAADAHTETGILVDATRKAVQPQNKFVVVLKTILGSTETAAALWYYLSH